MPKQCAAGIPHLADCTHIDVSHMVCRNNSTTYCIPTFKRHHLQEPIKDPEKVSFIQLHSVCPTSVTPKHLQLTSLNDKVGQLKAK